MLKADTRDSRLDSLHAWCILATAFRESFQLPERRYLVEVKEFSLSPTEYFAGLDSKSINWLTCLRVKPSALDQSDLVQIAQLHSVAVLDLSTDGFMEPFTSKLDERIFKSWTSMIETGAFQHLRVMLLRGQPHIAAWLFKYLAMFPALAFVVCTDCRYIHQKSRNEWRDEAIEHGWDARHGKRSARSMKELIDDEQLRMGAISRCYYHVESLLSRSEEEQRVHRKPIVEAWLGGPKPWTHLIDEFPGTRTVWFDNTRFKDSEHSQAQRRTKRSADMLSSSGESARGVRQNSAVLTTKPARGSLQQVLEDLGRTNASGTPDISPVAA